MRIYVDLDDVISETTPRIVELLNRRFDRSLRFDELDCFDLGRAFSLSPREHALALDAVHEVEFLRALTPRPGAVALLERWAARGCEIDIITGRPPRTFDVSAEWLCAHAVPHGSFHCVDKYGRYPDEAGTLEMAGLLERSFAVAIEDSAEMAARLAMELRPAGSAVRVLLMDRPWNRNLSELPHEARARIERVADWAEVAERIPEPSS